MKAGITIVAVLGLVGCETASKTADKTALAAGVTAMVAASPLIPVVDGVRAVTGQRERTEEAVMDLRAKLDQVFTARIASLESRDPVADAILVHQLGHIGFLSVTQAVSNKEYFPGVSTPEYDLNGFAARQSATGSEQFNKLQDLVRVRPEEVRPDPSKPRYSSPVLTRFHERANAFMAAFNQEMYRRWQRVNGPNRRRAVTPSTGARIG